MRKIFRYSEYNTFNIAFATLGFIIFFYIFIFGIEHQKFEWRYWWVLLPLILPFFNPSGFFRKYLIVENKSLIIKNEFTKKIIPVVGIEELIYERRTGYHFLVIKYVEDKIEKQAERNVEFFNTKTLNDLNSELKSIKHTIEIIIDDDSEKYQQKRKNFHLRTPQSTIGWIKFAVGWIITGFLVAAVILGIPYLINPSIYPHGK